MTVVSDEFRRRWKSGVHVGAHRPRQRVWLRTGRLRRSFAPWPGGGMSRIKIPGETAAKPWQATWTPDSPWVEIPGVMEASLEQDFASDGVAQLRLTLENTLMREASNLGVLFHHVERGALSPWRGFNAPGTPPWAVAQNEWYGKLAQNSQIKVEQGYGDDTLTPVFTGLIDDVDLRGAPGAITVVARDFGQALTDQRAFGDVCGPRLLDPLTFRRRGSDPSGKGEPTSKGVGFRPESSSTREGHVPRFATDASGQSIWLSDNRALPTRVEWLSVRVPKGRYESIAIHPHYPDMEVFVGVRASSRLLGNEPAELDDLNIPDGWVRIPEDEGGGVVPTDNRGNGGFPFIKRWSRLPKDGRVLPLDHKLEVGEDTEFRVAFTNLYKIRDHVHRAGLVRFAPVKQPTRRTQTYKKVGFKAEASSQRADEYKPDLVVDARHVNTRWISTDRGGASGVEWVEIHVPQGSYQSIQVYTQYPGQEAYVGIYARPRKRKIQKGPRKGQYLEYPAQVDDIDINHGVDPANAENLLGRWVRLGDYGLTGGGSMPDDNRGNGGWPYVKKLGILDKHRDGKAERFRLDHKFELGRDSVIRIGLTNLYRVPGTRNYRASVGTLRANTRSSSAGADPAGGKRGAGGTLTPPPQYIEVDDVSDIVRVVLRWAGFKEWNVENTGAKLEGDYIVDRQTTLRQIIKKVEEDTGFVFFIAGPTSHDLSIGIPVFRHSYLLHDDLPDLQTIKDSELLTGIQAKLTDEPLAHVIRTRGKRSKKGVVLGGDRTPRLMSTYRPPWGREGRLAGLLKHFVHTQDRFRNQKSLEVFSRLVALRQALASATAEIELPGTPEFDLDGQIVLHDESTGLKTRLYVARRSSVFQGGAQTKYTTTLGGSLLDTPDIVGVKADLREFVPPTQAIASLANGLGSIEDV